MLAGRLDPLVDPLVLVVDDEKSNHVILQSILGDCRVASAFSGNQALYMASQTPPDLILLDICIPGVDGYEIFQALKDNPVTADVPIIFITSIGQDAEVRSLEMGAVDFILKPLSPGVVRARVALHLSLVSSKRLQQAQVELVHRLGRAAEFRDNETGLHVVRMAHYARLIARRLGINDAACELIFEAAPMHDIGKIGIPDAILLKPGALTPEERVIMNTHATIGGELLDGHDSELVRLASELAFSHHEKWDGSGYPRGLKGEDIPLSGRIIAVADVFDALTSVRPYKPQYCSFRDSDMVPWPDNGQGDHPWHARFRAFRKAHALRTISVLA